MVVIYSGDGRSQSGSIRQNILDKNVLLWYYCYTASVANLYFGIYQEGKVADTA